MQKQPLHQEMRSFRRQKKVLIPVLILLGLVGLLLPVLPGLVLLALAAALMWPGREWKLGKQLSRILGNRFGSRVQ